MTKPPNRQRQARAGRLEQRAQLRGTQEIRKFSAIVAGANAVRSASTSSGIEITGSPIVYNTPYPVFDSMGSFEETMLPGVVSKILGTCDCRFLLNHSRETIPLARTTSRTLRLSDGPDALRFSATLDPRQSLANDLAVAIERGDITQMSCAFVVESDSWNDTFTKRTISEFAELLDVSAVTYPASPTTSIDLAPTDSYGMTSLSAASGSAGDPNLYRLLAQASALGATPRTIAALAAARSRRQRSGMPLSLAQARARTLALRNEAGRRR